MNNRQMPIHQAVVGTLMPATPTTVPAVQIGGTLPPANQTHYVAPTDLAWAAGFFDGDGCITATWQVRKGRPNPDMRIQVNVAQNDYRTLQHFQRILGAHGKIYPLKRKAIHNRQCWYLVYWGQHALDVLRMLLPYLRRKQQEALLCMQINQAGNLTTHPGPSGHSADIWKLRRQFFEKLKRLK